MNNVNVIGDVLNCQITIRMPVVKTQVILNALDWNKTICHFVFRICDLASLQNNFTEYQIIVIMKIYNIMILKEIEISSFQ